MALPTAAEITRLYLFGQTTIPPDLLDAQRIRSTAPVTQATAVNFPGGVNVNDYIELGPGRFVNAASFDVIKRFFNNAQQLAPSPVGGYRKEDLFRLFGLDGSGDLARRAVFINQADYSDGTNDLLERAYIWGSTAFQIDPAARFIVDVNGTRSIDNFGIVPFSAATNTTPADTENFDFVGGGAITAFANTLLLPIIDPSNLGRIVNIPFAGKRRLQATFTQADFNIAVASRIAPTSVANLQSIFNGSNQFIQRLFADGSIRLLDANDRPILYGTDGNDPIQGSIAISGTDVSRANFINALFNVNQPLANFVQNGIAYIAGKGTDRITAGTTKDYLDGGVGNDTLNGGEGDDYLIGGADADTLIGGAGLDTYVFKANEGKDTITDSDGKGVLQIAGNKVTGIADAAKFVTNSTTRITTAADASGLSYSFRDDGQNTKVNLTIKAGGLGTGEVTITDFDLTAAQGKDGYLGIKLNRTAQSAITSASQTSPFALANAVLSSFSQTISEGSAAALKWYGNLAAAAGDTLTVTARNGANVSLITGNDTLSLANPITLELATGQTERGFALVSDKAIDADQTVELVVTYNRNGEKVDSNTFTLTLQDRPGASATAATLQGDLAFDLNESGSLMTDEQGRISTTGQSAFGQNDLLFGGDQAERILGGEGSDVLNGGGGAVAGRFCQRRLGYSTKTKRHARSYVWCYSCFRSANGNKYLGYRLI